MTISNTTGGIIEGTGSSAVIRTGSDVATINEYGAVTALGSGKAIDFVMGTGTLNILGGAASITGDITGDQPWQRDQYRPRRGQ